ncbi:nucleotidyltransferase family protein [Pseudomonas aeruginosa]
MGGNALAEFDARRVTKAVAMQMFDQVSEVIGSLPTQSGAYRHEMVKAYREKPDFGDLDILVDREMFKAKAPAEIIKEMERAFGCTIPWIKNGPVLSFGAPLEQGVLQVDLISSPAEEFDFSSAYYSWNDLGNLMGRVAHKMGLTLGHDGLRLPLRDKTHMFKEIMITRDFGAAIELLGFNAARWAEGFDNLEQIYEFASSSARFNPDIYKLENRNHTARMRDRKRPVYTAFLKWIDENEDSLPRFAWNEDKNVYLVDVFKAFPHVRAEYDASWEELNRQRAARDRLNGDVVSQATGFAGKQLGEFFAHLKRENEGIMERVLEMTEGEIQDVIKRAVKTFDRSPGPSM